MNAGDARVSAAAVDGLLDLNPSRPLFHAGSAPNRIRQRQRRAAILARARALLARNGYSSVQIRQIASDQGLSVQTLYNLVGSKRVLLERAVVEFLISIESGLDSFQGYPNRILALTDLLWQNAVANPDFVREATLACIPPNDDLRAGIQKCTMTLMAKGFAELAARGALNPNTPVSELSALITRNLGYVMLDHLTDDLNAADLRRDLLFCTTRLVMGSVDRAEADRMERWMQEALGSSRPGCITEAR